MKNIPYIFSDGSLFQADSDITITGETEKNSVLHAKILYAGKSIVESESHTDERGCFSVTLKTPSPSFKEYDIILSCLSDTYIIRNVLFGELWLAAGQSNMQFMNSETPRHEKMLGDIMEKKIRVFCPKKASPGDFPNFPEPLRYGRWCFSDDANSMEIVSAVATKFASDIYDYLNMPSDVPVGFALAAYGGATIDSFFSPDHIRLNSEIQNKLINLGAISENGLANDFCGGVSREDFQKTSAQYNTLIAPLNGTKFRGIIWYQGETEVNTEYGRKNYPVFLAFLYDSYREMFAAYDKFMFLSVLLYPFSYNSNEKCKLGYINDAFVEASKKPLETRSASKIITKDSSSAKNADSVYGKCQSDFRIKDGEIPLNTAHYPHSFIPIYDLEPTWNYFEKNSAIHPSHKYKVGERLARLAEICVYGKDGQRSPAVLDSFTLLENRMRLKFINIGSGLRLPEECDLHGMYIAGDDGIYLPAEAKIVSDDTLDIWNDEISSPKNAAYAVQSLDINPNLFAGDFPAAPFYTDKEKPVSFESRPWYDATVNSVFEGNYQDSMFHPLWNPAGETEICHDSAFTLEKGSIRAMGIGGNFGFFIKKAPYSMLDFEKFAGMSFSLYNMNGKRGEMIITTWEKDDVVLPMGKADDLGGGFEKYIVRFGALPESEIRKITFMFYSEKKGYDFINIERLRLLKK